MINLTFVFFQVIMLLILGVGGFYVQKYGKNSYWKYMLFPIIVFTLNEGLRWGRGIDYNLYYFVYERIAVNKGTSDFEPVFTWLVQLFGMLSLTWQHFVAFMSFILILAGCIFLKNYKKVIVWALPLFALNVFLAENLMRWFLGFSFILIGVYFLTKDRKYPLLFCVFSLIGVLCHYGLILIIPIFYFVHKISKPLLSPKFSIPILIASIVLFQGNMMLFLTKYINLITFSGRYEIYQQNLSTWLTKSTVGKETQLDFNVLIMNLFLVYGGYMLYDKFRLSHKYVYAYNLFLIGVLSFCMKEIEIAYRYSMLFSLFSCVILAYLIHAIIIKKYINDVYFYIATWFIVLNFIRTNILVHLFGNPNHLLYIWDSAGKKTLDMLLW